jgi:hypothetical protein
MWPAAIHSDLSNKTAAAVGWRRALSRQALVDNLYREVDETLVIDNIQPIRAR